MLRINAVRKATNPNQPIIQLTASAKIIDFKRVILRRLKLGIADGVLKADGEPIYHATDLRVGLFQAGEAPTATGA